MLLLLLLLWTSYSGRVYVGGVAVHLLLLGSHYAQSDTSVGRERKMKKFVATGAWSTVEIGFLEGLGISFKTPEASG